MLENFDLRLLKVGYDQNWRYWQWKDVCSPFARIYLVEHGSAVLYMEGKKLELKRGRLYLIPPFVRHNCMGKEGFSHFYVHLYEWPEAGVSIFNDIELGNEADARPGDREIFQMLVRKFPESSLDDTDPKVYDNERNLLTSCGDFTHWAPSDKMLVKGAMLVLISRFIAFGYREMPKRDPKIVKVCSYINTHMSSALSVPQLAESACMSESHFLRIFKREMGMTPAQYIIKCRIQNAQLFLLVRNEPVKNIAASVGFFDASHFVKTFKKITGMTPQEFRNRPLPDLNLYY